MAVQTTCPDCKATLKVPSKKLGHCIICPKCKVMLAIKQPEQRPPMPVNRIKDYPMPKKSTERIKPAPIKRRKRTLEDGENAVFGFLWSALKIVIYVALSYNVGSLISEHQTIKEVRKYVPEGVVLNSRVDMITGEAKPVPERVKITKDGREFYVYKKGSE